MFGIHLGRHWAEYNPTGGKGSNDDVERTARMIFHGAAPLLLQNVVVEKKMYQHGGLANLHGGAA